MARQAIGLAGRALTEEVTRWVKQVGARYCRAGLIGKIWRSKPGIPITWPGHRQALYTQHLGLVVVGTTTGSASSGFDFLRFAAAFAFQQFQ